MIKLEDFFQKIQVDLQSNEYWHSKLIDPKCKIHLAFMVEPYLSLILSGKKTIESRFSTKKNDSFQFYISWGYSCIKKSGEI